MEDLKIAKKNIKEVVVVSTMSSGKSTFINAMLGKELLPAMNQACTSKLLSIVDNDEMNDFIAHLKYKDGRYKKVKALSKDVVEQYQSDDDVRELVLEGNIRSVYNTNKRLVMVDTPGINNTQRDDRNVTIEYLKGFTEGIIIYIINVNQIGTNDDEEILLTLKELVGKREKVEFMFVVNKMDEINRGLENPKDLIMNVKSYLEKLGFQKPSIYPVCAAASSIFTRLLNGEQLNIDDSINFIKYYELFKSTSWDLKYLCVTAEENKEDFLEILNNKYARHDIQAALDNTGIAKVQSELMLRMLDGIKQEVQMKRKSATQKRKKGAKKDEKRKDKI